MHFRFLLYISVRVDCRPLSQQIYTRTSSNSIRKETGCNKYVEDQLNVARKNLAKCPFDEKDGNKYFEDICSLNGWSDKNAVLSFFSRHNMTALHAKFHICQTLRSSFLQIILQIFDKLCEIKYSFENLENFASSRGKIIVIRSKMSKK